MAKFVERMPEYQQKLFYLEIDGEYKIRCRTKALLASRLGATAIVHVVEKISQEYVDAHLPDSALGL